MLSIHALLVAIGVCLICLSLFERNHGLTALGAAVVAIGIIAAHA